MQQTNYQELYPGWKTVKRIGVGSFGTVFEIERDLFGKTEKAALKYISIPQNEGDVDNLYANGYDDEEVTSYFKDTLEDIVREYSTMAEIKGHTNIVYCDDIRFDPHADGVGWDIFIKMELLTPMPKALGITVSDQEVIKVGRDICNALVHCKSKGIVHRDIKPQNIFVSDTGDYKLGDFGIAKTVERTTGGTQAGTLAYMAPEVANFQPYGTSADLYSLGLVLYWLLNERRLPFLPLPPEKIKFSMDEEARKRRFTGVPLPAPAHGSADLKKIVLKACAFDPKDRYQSASEMLHDLNEGFGSEAELRRLEEERLRKELEEKLRKEREEQERLRKAQEEELHKEREEQERLRKELEEKLRKEREDQDQQRKAQEEDLRKEREEQERLRKVREEQERLQRELAEQERLRKEKEEQKRLRKEKLKQEKKLAPNKRWLTAIVLVAVCLLCLIFLRFGWRQQDDGKYMYYRFGMPVTEWQKISDNYYYFGDDGLMRTYLQTIDGKWYYFGKTDGIMKTGWQTIDGKWYYFGKTDGIMRTGWQKIDGKTYYFGETDGIMRTGWQTIDGKTYYFGKTDGIMRTGWWSINRNRYYFNSSGIMVTGWQKIDGKTYYFSADGTWRA